MPYMVKKISELSAFLVRLVVKKYFTEMRKESQRCTEKKHRETLW